ncbi:zinc finger protein 106 [Betta splendens]|uniref:Zinc finger protein 106 n=1 Tax=Betta splendens TaxID=158456 RepID=A0A6P7LKC7_BETSP|nr:zinc finger protein 106 [Betta splendens]XP_028994795.1 zinc finger protein 106 [Betta splendens]
MARERKCILCETVHVSKQEMNEHMRSMLHHRELEKLKGRDCGHECTVCKVTLVSLTDYASHISSPTHKQNVEAAEQSPSWNGTEDYFDQALVELIEKRKEQIRKEKEAAAAKQAAEEAEQRREEEFQQRLKEAKERYRIDCSWKQPSHGFNRSNQHSSWYRANGYNARPEEAQPWRQGRQGKSATWHAQEPPSFQNWGSGHLSRGGFHSQQGWGRKQWDQGAFPANQKSRFPWLSNGGSRNGLYGQNNISQYPQKSRPVSRGSPVNPPLPNFFAQAMNQFPNADNEQGGQQGDRFQNRAGQAAESDHSTKNSKTFGSNPKLDKTCRWAPYPVTKSLESIPCKDNTSNAIDKYSKGPAPKTCDKQPESSAFNKVLQTKQKPGQTLDAQSVEGKAKQKVNTKTKPKSASSSSTHAQGEAQQNSSGPSKEKSNKSLSNNKLRKMSSVPCLKSDTELSKSSIETHAPSKPTTKQSGLQGSKALQVGPLQSKQESQLAESIKKARQIVLKKSGSLDSASKTRQEMARHSVEVGNRSLEVLNKENSCRQNVVKPNVPDSMMQKPSSPSADSSQFLQSLQVTTSNLERSQPAASSREDEESRKKVEKGSGSPAQDEALHDDVAGQSSEGDTPPRGEVQGVSGSSSLPKLDLLPVLKRDLAKHICPKSHEPNLNIARRVRNLSESRKVDTDKDSGLRPTVRQLISFSGSRRNVNWEQVYQEVRKKQDKGKGMPRFGIEMVPYDQEENSQEEDDIPVLEGFQWESLMDISAPSATRKRSLSESSVTPAAVHSLFLQREGLGSEEPGASVPPMFSQEKENSEKGVELGQLEARAKKQPHKLTSAGVEDWITVLGDSSGTEQHDGQGTGKRRRAAADAASAETSGLEHNSKRRKVKSKKERLQIDQLLAVSLREEEVSRSLQTVDASLIQARATLQAAYLEVQRLMVVKQQVTAEMSTLRNKRIEILKGMQGSVEESPQIKLKEKTESFDTEPHVPSFVPSSSSSGAAAPSITCSSLARRSSPPSSSLTFKPVVIKEEPQSPVSLSSEMDADHIARIVHSTTPELPVDAANKEQMWDNFRAAGHCNPTLSGVIESTEKAVQSTRIPIEPDSKSPIKSLLLSRRGSETGSTVDCADTQSLEPPSGPSAFNVPESPSELRSGKRVRKLKKRKVLKKAEGPEQPYSSDTEMEGEATRPRFLRPRRRPSGGSQVSTSTQPTEVGEDINVEGSEEPGKAPSKSENTNRSHEHMAALPQVASIVPPLKLEPEEAMEITEASQQPQTQAFPAAPAPDSYKPEPQSLACNEVTSTSDMDVCRSSESEMPVPTNLPKINKTSSDASSDHGEDEMPMEGVFEGHQEAVNAMQVHNGLLYTCSGDRTVRAFDLVSRRCVAVFEGHSSKVSCLLVSVAPSLHHRLYSGSSDQTIRCYSLKTQELEQQFSLPDRVLCFHSRWKTLYAGLANGTVVTFNLKTNRQMDAFECHGPRAVSCLASSQEGSRRILLVGSYDSTISVRDAKNGLLLRALVGHTKTVLCMKVVNDLVFSGSSDQCVYAHNIHTGELVQVYNGHSHAVSVVTVLGKVMVTACLDKLVRVYDLQTHNQLQVYGGHKDMVMCMAIHKNMIYTGCYDGSVQAVKLNLMQNYRCWWHGCSMVFAVKEHLQQHLIDSHTNPSLQKLRCRWKNCEEFLCTRNSSKQGLLVHMQKHAEEETDVEP